MGMRTKLLTPPLLTLCLCLHHDIGVGADDTESALEALRSVGPEGRGNVVASAAIKQLVEAGPGALIEVLSAMDGASPLAMNWLRAAAESNVSRELAAGAELPLNDLEAFLGDHDHSPRARRFAWELIARSDRDRSETLLAGMLNDPSTELRRDAVQRSMDAAAADLGAGHRTKAIKDYQKSLAHARDVDQIEAVTAALTGLGERVDLQDVFGWLTEWKVIGPFDNTGGTGYDFPFPPEREIDFAAEYDGKNGSVAWKSLVTTNDYGKVDLNGPLGALKEVTGYAVAEVFAVEEREVELRLGCKNGWKLWLNGELLFGRDEYHRNTEIDHFRLKATLKPGRNLILVKVTQNELIEPWTVEWEFQLRITDSLGTPLKLAANR
jgi:hypothetical protein